MFDSLTNFIKDNCVMIVIALVIILILVIVIFGMGIGLASKSAAPAAEHMTLPWKNKSEHLFSGDMTPAEKQMFNKLAKANPVNSARVFEHMQGMQKNKEVPVLVSKLYS